MRKTLFLLCPTDCLETVVNNAFEHKNYFYTSLGNSFVSDTRTLESIKELILKHGIENICFVLSNDNQIILDALGGQFFSGVRGLKTFYDKITKQRMHSKVMWTSTNRQDLVLSCFLNNKIKELRLELENFPNNPIKINGKIYSRLKGTFKDIHPNLICLERYCLN